jgi:hypothetical protein
MRLQTAALTLTKTNPLKDVSPQRTNTDVTAAEA